MNLDERSALLGKDGMTRIANEVHRMTSGGGRTDVQIVSSWRSDIRWGRNTVSVAEDHQDYIVLILRRINGAVAFKHTNQISLSALQETVRFVEASARAGEPRIVRPALSPQLERLDVPSTPVWSEHTVGIPVNERARIAAALIARGTARDVMSSGYLEWRCRESMAFRFGTADGPASAIGDDSSPLDTQDDTAADFLAAGDLSDYIRHTQAQCSMTAFHKSGIGTGWAGLASFDWNAIPYETLATRAIEKCLAFTNPGVLEPGRYTAILEPQAVSTLVTLMVNALDRTAAERGRSAYSFRPDPQLRLWRTRLGMKMVDDRITIRHDPMDSMLGVLPVPGLRPVTWIEQGKLVSLSYNQAYAQRMLKETDANYSRPSYRMEGGTTSVEQMIQSTKHGVLITRLSEVIQLKPTELLVTGQTQDGMWEIKDGRLLRAVHNMRFTDSPLLALNAVESLGPAVPVFSPLPDRLMPIVVPSLKVNGFALTASLPSL